MAETLCWWLAATLIGVVALPYGFRLFSALPDRGVTLARTLGILMLVPALWLLSVVGLTTFSAGSAVLLLGVLAAGAVVLAGKDRRALGHHLRAHAPLVIAAEVVFAVTLVGIAALRAYQPEINATEKLFEFALLNGVLRSPQMPAGDPWFGGAPMSYYYGGYLVAALFTKLTGVSAAYGFNLGVILTGALVAVSAFGLGANLILAQGRGRGGAHGAAIAAGALSVVLLLVIGNLEGAIELAAAHGVGTPDWYQRLGIVNLTGQALTQRWYPDEFWFWWRATRMGSDWNIIEFPFFSFMLGDLHAHVMVLPFTLLGLCSVFALLREGRPLTFRTILRRPWWTLYLATLAGMLAFSNSWDQPVFLLLLAAAALLLGLRDGGHVLRVGIRAAGFVAPVALLSVALFLPFFVYLHPATQGIRPVEFIHPPAGVNREAMVSPPHHFLIVWGPLLIVSATAILLHAAHRRARQAPRDLWLVATTLTVAPLVLWCGAVIGVNRGVGPLIDEITGRATAWAFGSYWVVQFGVLALCVIGVVTLLLEAQRAPGRRRPARMYMTLAATGGLAVLHGIELFYVLEPAPSRINTLFKFSFIVWLTLATAGGAAAVDALRSWRRHRAFAVAAPWSALAGATLLLALVYPVTAAMNRTNGFTGPTTLDGLAFLRQTDPDEYEATAWLAESVSGMPLLLEAPGQNYSNNGRVSGRTGIPTVVGWQGHLAKLRGGRDYEAQERLIGRMAADMDLMYRTPDLPLARELLQRYGIRYVYVGRPELERFGVEGPAKFEQVGRAVFRNASVVIYQVQAADAPLVTQR
ncbi:MAG: DUF2298 domain-containing protein [Dehalococcoidia bacterium]